MNTNSSKLRIGRFININLYLINNTIYLKDIVYRYINKKTIYKMPSKKVREITITESKGAFSILKSAPKTEYDFTGLFALRQLLNNEKARILHVIKTQNPSSIYDLAKKLGRDFKSVSTDLKLLERFGFVDLVEERTKNRIRHKPVISTNAVTIHFKI